MPLLITGVELQQDGGLILRYGRLPDDMKKNGLSWNRAVQIPAGSDYDDELEAVYAALQALLEDVVEDYDLAEHVEANTDPEEEDDDE